MGVSRLSFADEEHMEQLLSMNIARYTMEIAIDRMILGVTLAFVSGKISERLDFFSRLYYNMTVYIT